MVRLLLVGLTGWPSEFMQTLITPFMASAYKPWNRQIIIVGFRQASSSSSASTRHGELLKEFAHRLPNRLHPDDLHYLLKHLEGFAPPSMGVEAAKSCRGTTHQGTTDGAVAGAGAGNAANLTVADTEGQSNSSSDRAPLRSGWKLNCATTSTNVTNNGFDSAAASAGRSSHATGRSHSTTSDASGSSYRAFNIGTSRSSHRHGHSKQGQHNVYDDIYDDEYDHLHNMVFQRLPRQSHTHIRVELHGSPSAVSGTPEQGGGGEQDSYGRGRSGHTSSTRRSRSCNWQFSEPHLHHHTSGPGPDMGPNQQRMPRRWWRSWPPHGDRIWEEGEEEEEEEGGEGARGPRRHNSRRRRYETVRRPLGDDDTDKEEGEWASGVSTTQHRGRTHRHRCNDSDNSDTRHNSYQQTQRHQQQKHREEPRRRQCSETVSQQQQQQSRQQQHHHHHHAERRQGTRGVAWFSKRWPKHYVNYKEYVEFMSQDWNREESPQAGGGRIRSKFYQSAFEDDRDWFSQFWNDGTTGGDGSASKQSEPSYSRSRSAEQFTSGWWQRFQAAASDSGASSWSSSTSSSRGATGFSSDHSYNHHHHNHQRQQQHSFGGQHSGQYGGRQPDPQHYPELHTHMLVLGLDVGRSLDAAVVKAAFRARAKETHPDLQHGADAAVRTAAEERFKAVQQAYQALSRAVGAAD
ncbi:hypothetical protein VaNZ11_003858 [Volvox africanus]|uniref:J domain-containing protein n=1 Tax=Volvox africanus TaxID=51714 RepID=A0ABQ5RV08_9CHLO|nr:hypothetical protein VaNZ11_003858 [Volvox africanus]